MSALEDVIAYVCSIGFGAEAELLWKDKLEMEFSSYRAW